MNPIIICLIIAASITYIWDYVNFPRNFLARIYSLIFKREILLYQVKLPKIFECSLCATTWSTLLILLIMNWKLAPLCLLFGWSTTYILQIFNLIDKLLNDIIKIIDKILTL